MWHCFSTSWSTRPTKGSQIGQTIYYGVKLDFSHNHISFIKSITIKFWKSQLKCFNWGFKHFELYSPDTSPFQWYVTCGWIKLVFNARTCVIKAKSWVDHWKIMHLCYWDGMQGYSDMIEVNMKFEMVFSCCLKKKFWEKQIDFLSRSWFSLVTVHHVQVWVRNSILLLTPNISKTSISSTKFSKVKSLPKPKSFAEPLVHTVFSLKYVFLSLVM